MTSPRLAPRITPLRSARSNAKMTAPAIVAMPAIIRKNIVLSMLLQKLPSQPARKLPVKLVASHSAHHHRDHARRRHLRHERQPDRREIELADGDDREIAEQPQPARLRRPPPLPGGADHDQIGERHAEAAERHLGDGRGLARRAAPATPTARSRTGVKAKIMNGLKAWNQVIGISPCQTSRLIVRSV